MIEASLPYEVLTELRSVVLACTLGDQNVRLSKVLDTVIDSCENRIRIENNPVSE